MKTAAINIDTSWFVEQERRIQALTLEASRLRMERWRLFHQGFLYVVEFDSGVVKVGKTGKPRARLSAHSKAGLIVASWVSDRHLHCDRTERQLIEFCRANGSLYGGLEYFRDLPFSCARAHAEVVVAEALRQQAVST